jgi:hypothetical protein
LTLTSQQILLATNYCASSSLLFSYHDPLAAVPVIAFCVCSSRCMNNKFGNTCEISRVTTKRLHSLLGNNPFCRLVSCSGSSHEREAHVPLLVAGILSTKYKSLCSEFLATDPEVPGSIPDEVIGFFS